MDLVKATRDKKITCKTSTQKLKETNMESRKSKQPGLQQKNRDKMKTQILEGHLLRQAAQKRSV